MEEEKRKAYSEVVEVLKLIEDEEKIEKIPFEVIQLIKANSDPTYKPTINKDISLEDQNLRTETYSILGWIANKYWEVDTVSSQEETNTAESENNDITEVDLDRINIEDIELKAPKEPVTNAIVYNDIEPEALDGKNLPVLAYDKNWFEKLKSKVIELFKTIFRISTKNREKGVINETGLTK